MSDYALGLAPSARDVLSQQSRRPATPRRAIAKAFRQHPVWMAALAAVCALIILLAIGGYFLGWTWTGFKGNTFWDWLSLLITPVTIAVISAMFSYQQSQWSAAANERKRQEEMLQAYYDHITHLLLERGLLETRPDSPVRAVARARTVATWRQLGQEHRGALRGFLDEAGLTHGEEPILDLAAIEDPAAARGDIA